MISQSAPRPVTRMAIALLAMAAGAGVALDAWQRGWTTLGLVGTVGAALAALCAMLGRVTRRPVFEQAAPIVAIAGLLAALLGALVRRVG